MQSLGTLLGHFAIPLLLVLALAAFTPPPALAQSAPLALAASHQSPSVPSDVAASFGVVEREQAGLSLTTPLLQELEMSQHVGEPILQYFDYEHLPSHLQVVSKPFGDLARELVTSLPRNPERSVALRKLLEGKDAAVRAALTSGG